MKPFLYKVKATLFCKYVIIRILTFYKSHLILFLAVCQILYQMA